MRQGRREAVWLPGAAVPCPHGLPSTCMGWCPGVVEQSERFGSLMARGTQEEWVLVSASPAHGMPLVAPKTLFQGSVLRCPVQYLEVLVGEA